MKTATSNDLQLNFRQVVQIVKQLSLDDKIKLSKELEREAINSKLTKLLKSFKTNELREEVISGECEAVRESIYLKSHEK